MTPDFDLALAVSGADIEEQVDTKSEEISGAPEGMGLVMKKKKVVIKSKGGPPPKTKQEAEEGTKQKPASADSEKSEDKKVNNTYTSGR